MEDSGGIEQLYCKSSAQTIPVNFASESSPSEMRRTFEIMASTNTQVSFGTSLLSEETKHIVATILANVWK